MVGNVTMEDEAEDVAGAEVVDVVEVGAEEAAFAFNFRGKAPVRLEISADFRTADSPRPIPKLSIPIQHEIFPLRPEIIFWIVFSIPLFSNTNHIQE